jgi:hypothetical protein
MNETKEVIFKPVTLNRFKSVILSVIGWLFAIFFGICLIAGSFMKWSENSLAGLVFCFICTGIGIFLIIMGRKIKNRTQKIIQYANIIEIQKETNVDRIADSINKSVDSVITDIQSFISQGNMTGVYLDLSTHEIVFRKPGDNIPVQGVSNNTLQVEKDVICKACGATNHLPKGSDGKCEYCGSMMDDSEQ